jgi:hypothetical protein
MGPFGLGYGAFDSNMIDMSVIVSALSLGVKIGVEASGNYEDCAVGREGIRLLQRFTDWRWRWRRWVGFGFDLRIGVRYMICVLSRGMLFVELAKIEDGWLLRNGRIGNMPELGIGYFGMLVVGKVKGRMESTDCEAVANASCDLLLGMMIVVKAGWSLAPSFFSTRGRWDSLLCDGWFCCCETCSTEV